MCWRWQTISKQEVIDLHRSKTYLFLCVLIEIKMSVYGFHLPVLPLYSG
jgi:hypothetical protein